MFADAIISLAIVMQPAQAGPPDLNGLTFEVVGEPGVERTEFGPNNSFTDYYNGEVAKTGTYSLKDNGDMCFSYEAAEEPACWTMEGLPDAEGWQTSVRASDGLRIRVRPLPPQD